MEAVMVLVLTMAGQATAAEWVPRLVAYAAQYEATLPALECDESIVSEELKHGQVKQEVRIEGTFRVVRTGTGNQPFAETHEYRTVNGAAPPKHFSFPLLLQGAFSNGLGFRQERVKCFEYRKEADGTDGNVVIVSTARADAGTLEGCKEVPAAVVKRTVVDGVSGHVTHVEASMPEESAKRYKAPYFAAIDYGPVQIGEETFWLPVRVASHDANEERRFRVTYTNFHRYGGSMRIVSTPEVSTPQ